MSGLDLSKKLWRIPQQGMVRGVCAGLAHYLDVPVKLVRVVTVLSIFFGLAFITLVAYIVLSFVLDPMPEGELAAEGAPTSNDLLNAVARKPVRMLLAVALEPLLQKVAKRLSRRYFPQ